MTLSPMTPRFGSLQVQYEPGVQLKVKIISDNKGDVFYNGGDEPVARDVPLVKRASFASDLSSAAFNQFTGDDNAGMPAVTDLLAAAAEAAGPSEFRDNLGDIQVVAGGDTAPRVGWASAKKLLGRESLLPFARLGSIVSLLSDLDSTAGNDGTDPLRSFNAMFHQSSRTARGAGEPIDADFASSMTYTWALDDSVSPVEVEA